ncbi:GNAT family N-acetyltransferase [Neptunicella marina]|uniref:N-acetyltransferase n=1 Tax=Neptunicella marina TaxID=2125989 RepID=A0A8J6M0Q5_9ALTE|nr:GNAT family N-acetyltransferase [Neptunicella marina]MBC3765083.1 N-acetyltransferase [Neptunicella marina]
MSISIQLVSDISSLPRQQFNCLERHGYPFLTHDFLQALEQQHCVGGNSGWQAQHLAIYQQQQLIAFVPVYQKSHSYGEYVFDFSWADAYAHHGLDYFPKLVAAIPFTPVPGPRLITVAGLDSDTLNKLYQQIDLWFSQQPYSSLHWLFIPESQIPILQQHGYAIRHSVQFHWFNHDYQQFDDFLARCNSRKRKMMRKERQKVTLAGVTVSRVSGQDLSAEHMRQFYHCYCATYLKRSGHSGYLSEGFFLQCQQQMADNMLLVMAHRDEELIASALFFFDDNNLYGRYWGALEEVDALHFECCFYQGIEFCIERGISIFNPGTQGEHKILRGFEPSWCYSAHKLQHADFQHAIANFVIDEHKQLQLYHQQASSLLPYKSD